MDLASMKNGINSPTIEGSLRHKGQRNNSESEKITKRPSFSKINQQHEIIIETLKEYTWEEKFEWMHQKLLKADRLLNKKRPDLTTQTCLDALLGLDFNCSDENQKRIINEIQVPCLLLLACCMRLKKDYAEGISYCNKAVELNRKNPNCFITRALLLQASKDFNNALNDFKSAQKLAEKDERFDLTEYQENIKAVSRKVRARKDSTDELKPAHEVGMEGYDEDDEHHEQLTIAGSRTSLDEDEGSGSGAPKILRYNDDLEELNRFGVFRYAVYPFKISMKYFKGKAEFCRRRKPNYEAIGTDP